MSYAADDARGSSKKAGRQQTSIDIYRPRRSSAAIRRTWLLLSIDGQWLKYRGSLGRKETAFLHL